MGYFHEAFQKAVDIVSDLTGGEKLIDRQVKFLFYDINIGLYVSYGKGYNSGNEWLVGGGYQARISLDASLGSDNIKPSTIGEARLNGANYSYIIKGPVAYFMARF